MHTPNQKLCKTVYARKGVYMHSLRRRVREIPRTHDWKKEKK